MNEIVKINLENEMDLILSHKRSMKLAELCGLSVLTQTSFATAVSEISRCLIGDEFNRSSLTLLINTLQNNRKELIAVLTTNDIFEKKHTEAIKYAQRLTDNLKINKQKDVTEVILTQKINFSGLINDTRIQAFINYFKKELPLSPYDEIRKKNIQLLEISEKLKDSETQYKMLTGTLPLMMFTANGGGYLTYGNKWLKDYFGFLEIQSGKIEWTSLVQLSETKSIRDEWEKAQTNQSPFRAQAKLKAKGNDSALWHLISLVPVKNELNQITSWTGFFVDIHAQKVVEETLKNNVELKTIQKKLLNYQGQLEEKVNELNKSNHDLEQFAYIASHDLQEPLRKIQSFTELLELNFTDKERSKKYLEKIDYASSRMSSLIKDVLNYSRLSQSGNSFGETDLQKILEHVKSDVELIVEKKEASIKSDKLPVINGINQQLYQLFYNLINNALKFSTEKPVLKISCRQVPKDEIVLYNDLSPENNYIELIFKDNGIGFEQKHAKQIFTIFKRLNSKEKYEGTGIGLALCKKIIDNHHGSISVTSELGIGTSFNVILPVE
ncbi:PAS domain-containing sensor histidine kinase [Cytophaga aurantiaca]|uniref:PAS domain-containing sensor histidine kinase n=1 Tax=Cytophaga aurantiaca TaxID=29530 RepID=UPI0003617E2A|nr:ATP-binding protein [Cytophaga aurantiaca]